MILQLKTSLMAVKWLALRSLQSCQITLFCLFMLCLPAIAQQPGGVNGTKLWYVSQKGSPNFLIDISGNRYPPVKPQTLSANNRNLNFHEAAFFPQSATASTNIPYKNFDGDQLTIIGLFYPKQVPDWKKTPYFISTAEVNSKNQLFYNTIIITDADKKEKKYSFGATKNRTTFEIDEKFTTRQTAMKSGIFHQSTRDINFSVWGEEKTLTLSEWFTGYIPELMIYSRVLTPAEIVKVQTYLAIKYGITSDSSYILPNGTNIWNIKDPILSAFHHRVCAIAKDITAGLFQPKSNTSYEEGYLSYEHDAAFNNTHFNAPNNIMIPAKDSPSVFHSLTIGFTDMQSVPDGTYLIWGDNGIDLPADPLVYLDSLNQIKILNRIWLLKNPSGTIPYLKILLAGQSYYKDAPKSRMTIFEKIYQPFDYQFYRYLLIPLKSPDIKDTADFILNSYFGREQESNINAENFNTRFVVWDSVHIHKPGGISYFTFGKVPLLSFWEVIKKRGVKTDKIQLKYVYDRNVPLQTETGFDTTIADFRTTDSIQIKLSLGVAPVTVKLKEDKAGALWTYIQNTATTPAATSETGTESTVLTSNPGDENSTEEKHGDKRYIVKRPWKKELPSEYIKLQNLKTNTSYIIEARDRLGQLSTLRLRLKSVNPTPQH